MKILISGGDSKFSKILQKRLGGEIKSDYAPLKIQLIPISSSEMDITDNIHIWEACNRYKPDVFLHTAAISRPMQRIKDNPSLAISTNIIGTANAVNICIKQNIKFVYISTDYVYEGTTGNYSEEDPILPINEYAWSKLGGECAVKLHPNHLICRCAMTEFPFPHPKALIDVYKSSIWMEDAAYKVMHLITKEATGTFNIGGSPQSIYEFVEEKNEKILPISRKEISEPTPKDITLNTSKYDKFI